MSLCGGCCRWCAGFIFTLGLTALFMWLSLRPSKPDLSIAWFYIPALNKSANINSTSNASIFFDLKLENTNKDNGIYYDDLNLTVYYFPNRSRVANATVPHFYQGFKKTAHKKGNFSADGERAFWENATGEVLGGRLAKFYVRVETKVRYKIIRWKTNHHGLNLTADVDINEKGEKSTKKGRKFHSQGVVTRAGGGYGAPLVVVWMILALLIIV